MTDANFLIDNKSTKELLNNLPQDIIYQDLNHKIIWANTNIIKKYGSWESISGNYCYKVKYNHNEPCKHCLVERVKATGKSQIEEITRADGKTFLIKFSPIRDKENKIIAISE